METKTCDGCGQTFEIPRGTHRALLQWLRCASCTALGELEIQKANQTQARDADAANTRFRAMARHSEWEKLCPPLYRETDPTRLPCGRQTVENVMSWTYSSTGLLLHGPSGAGKSRLAWLLLEREHESGRSVKTLNSYDLSVRIPGLYSSGSEAVESTIRDRCTADLLLLDDVFKGPMTDRTESLVFEVVNYRSEHLLPIIATLNDTSESLTSRLSNDRGVPLLRRLREFSTVIGVGTKQ